MNKLYLIFVMCGFVSELFAQDSLLNTVKLRQAKNSAMVSSFDTILFKSDKKETIYQFTDIKLNDSVAKLEKIVSGKYTVTFSSKGMNFIFRDLAVCSKCDNEIEYYATINEVKDAVYTLVTELPGYTGGNLILARDFQSVLSKREKKMLNRTANFSISFFITKNKEVCDFMFTSNNLTSEKKEIVIKGMLKLKNWKISKQNGKPADELFAIDKDTLMKS